MKNFNATSIDLGDLPDRILKILNTVMGAFAGIVGMALVICAILYFIKLSFVANDYTKKRKYLNALKWVLISFIGIILIWSISGVVIQIIKNNVN